MPEQITGLYIYRREREIPQLLQKKHKIHARGSVPREKGFFGGYYSVNGAWFLLGDVLKKVSLKKYNRV